ncbi:MAG: hypothetical protein HFI07_11395 [Lachnospiraceae bacterium]|nr:hypothetical protein [Lachnospiraceae bacterium]
MNSFMRKLEIQPFVKYVVLKVDLLLETEIIDEANFSPNDEFAIMQFKNKYIREDNCVIVKVDM